MPLYRVTYRTFGPGDPVRSWAVLLEADTLDGAKESAEGHVRLQHTPGKYEIGDAEAIRLPHHFQIASRVV